MSLLVAGFALLGLAACHKESAAPAGAPSGPQPAPVHVATAQAMRVPVEATAFGNAESLATVEVRAQVNGEVQEVLFKEGDLVAQGQEMFRIDPRPFEVALAQAQANLARVQAQLAAAQANLRENEVRAKNAEVELKRSRTLLEQEIVTQEEFDQARTAAEAMIAAAGANSAGVAAAEEDIRAAQAEVEHAHLQLNYCTVRAPMEGRTGDLMIHVGDIVQAGAAEPMITIRQMKPMYVSFTLPERYLAQVRAGGQEGLPVFAVIPGSGMEPVQGRLTFIDNAVDNVTSTIRLKATFDNETDLLWPGQYVEVRVQLGMLDNAVTVPAKAVQSGQSGAYVFVVDAEGKAQLRDVTTGTPFGELVVIEEGLQPGEVVVADGHLRVSPGGPVKILENAEPAAS